MPDPSGPRPETLPLLPPSSLAAPDEQVVLEGTVQRVVFASDGGEFVVARLEVAGQKQPQVVVGPLGSIGAGQGLKVIGKWENHPHYGPRLRAVEVLPQIPHTEIGIERYLATLVGIGPELARRLVAHFGAEALEVLEKETFRVAQIKGVGKKRAQRAAADARQRREEREVMVFLQGQGISAAYATRIRRAYGAGAIARLKENPYQLARDVPGIGFQVADRIARGMGVDPLSAQRIEAGILYALDGAGDAGHLYLPVDELCRLAHAELRLAEEGGTQDPETLSQHLPALAAQGAMILEEDRAYSPRLYRAEVELARRIREINASERRHVPSIGECYGLDLSEGQLAALHMVAESPVCVITGGPGTGKTTIIKTLVRTYEAASLEVLLAAPTGRAAKRLSEATGRTASTVHRLLEWAPKEGFRRGQARQLVADLIVCDEASMLDVTLARALCAAVPRGATLLLVGDVDQLPSVGPGKVLSDLIESGAVPVARLKEIFRQAEGSGIVQNAHRILRGELPLSAAQGEPPGDFYIIEADEPAQIRDLVVRLVTERIPQRFGLDALREVQVLTPMHRGEAGTEELNRALQAALNPREDAAQTPSEELRGSGRVFRRGDKVMQVKNDYDRDVWNGDIGVVTRVDAEEGEMLVRFDESDVAYTLDDLEQLELAYAVSVHKSQGSEYRAVVVPLTMQHYVLLQRNLLYTAVTRGKELVVLIGSKRALWRAVREHRDVMRYTRLKERLSSIVAP